MKLATGGSDTNYLKKKKKKRKPCRRFFLLFDQRLSQPTLIRRNRVESRLDLASVEASLGSVAGWLTEQANFP